VGVWNRGAEAMTSNIPVLFAVPTSWLVILLVIVAVLAVWFLIRVVTDAVAWIRDECFDEYRDLRKKSQEEATAKRKSGENKTDAVGDREVGREE